MSRVQNSSFHCPLEEWTKYSVTIGKRQVEAWFFDGVFITNAYTQVEPSRVDSFKRIASADEIFAIREGE